MKRVIASMLMLSLVACGGSGLGGDDTTQVAQVPSNNTNSGNCAVNIGGDFVVCLDGDCNNVQPIEEPVIEEPVIDEPVVEVSSASSESSVSVEIPSGLRVSGKVSGVVINIPMCSDVTINQVENHSSGVPE